MIVVLTGSNFYFLHSELQKLIKEFSNKYGESIEKFDANELTKSDPVLDAVRSMSFLEPKKMVIVRDFAQNKQLLDNIEDIVHQTADSTDLVLVDPKLDKRTSAYKFLEKNCELKRFENLQFYELEKWASNESQKLKINISASDIKYFIERVGPNQQMLYQELKKLAFVDKNINRDVIDEMVDANPQSKVFDMLEALFSGNGDLAEKLYREQRAQGEEPQKIIAMITWQLQQLTMAIYSKTKSNKDLIDAGLSSYSANKALNLASNITKNDLVFLVNELAEIDMQSKTSADVESALVVYFSEVVEKIKK
jgi:DNA polymerase III delta subunit